MNRKEITTLILRNAFKNREGHIASSLSVLDALLCLHDIIAPKDDFILSKGHASLGLYAVYLAKGYISEQEFFTYCQFDSRLGGHPSFVKMPIVNVSTGSLGHGFPFAVGCALGNKMDKRHGSVYCLIGDGEANEGTIWESALIANTHNLNNLVCLMDFNKSGERAIRLGSCVPKFESFGWTALEVDGHDQGEIAKVLYPQRNRPLFVQLNTIKGKGCRLMENNPEWHHRSPASEEELERLIAETY